MRLLAFLYFIILWTSSILGQEVSLTQKWKTYLTHKEYSKAHSSIHKVLSNSKVDQSLKTAAWYYKGKFCTEEYFDDTNSQNSSEQAYLQKASVLQEGIAAFQNTVKRQDSLYSQAALRQLGGLHRYLKEIAFSFYDIKNYERFYLNLQWARNCDRFVQQYISPLDNYQMDTMLLYLLAYSAELTNRSLEAKYCYEALVLEGCTEEQIFANHYAMLTGLGETQKALLTLEQGLAKYPHSIPLLRSKLHWLMSNHYFEDLALFVNTHAHKLSTQEAARFYFVEGMAWNARYEEALQNKIAQADEYFQKTETAYIKALQLSPSTFDFAFNLAALYYNKVKLIQSPNYSLNKDSEDYALFMQRAAESLENTLHINADNPEVISALKDIYQQSNQKEKLLLLQKSKH